MADSKSGVRSEGGDWNGYFVSGQEALGYGSGFLVDAAKLLLLAEKPEYAEEALFFQNLAHSLNEWGSRFLSVEERMNEGMTQRQFTERWIEKNINNL